MPESYSLTELTFQEFKTDIESKRGSGLAASWSLMPVMIDSSKIFSKWKLLELELETCMAASRASCSSWLLLGSFIAVWLC